MDTEQFKKDVESRVGQLAQPEPGKMAAMDWSKISKALALLDGIVQKGLPVVKTLAPPQYDIFVEMAAQLIHGLVHHPAA